MYLSGHLLAVLLIGWVQANGNDPADAPIAAAPDNAAPEPKAKASAADRIQGAADRIEEEKSVDDVSVEDDLPKIADSDFCGAQVRKLCSHKVVQGDDYLVYNCLEQAASRGKLIDETCQHFLWIWKKAQTQNPQIQQEAIDNCARKKIEKLATDYGGIGECVKYYDQPLGKGNKLIPCLMDYRLQFNDQFNGHCRNFLTDVSRVIFGDYRLICNFLENCKADIEHHKCGRETFGQMGEEWTVDHSQGEVVHCLEEKLTENAEDEAAVSQECVKELVNLAELSADDFQLDRAFYLACVDDANHFDDCAKIPAGDGAVYRCLFKHKFDTDMTQDCQDAIGVREKLIYEADYKAGYHLHKKCRKTLKSFACDTAEFDQLQMSSEFSGLADMLMCVEKRLRSDDVHKKKPMVVDPDCDAELMAYRQYLMDDYQLSPEVVAKCKREIRDYCNGGLQRQGETVHCLMSLETDGGDEVDITEECTEALYELVEETEAEESFHVDKRLEAACAPAVEQLCPDTIDDDAEILSCLLENVHSVQLTKQHPACRRALLEVQYFLSRDFSWDKKFRRACAQEASDLCDAHDLGEVESEEEMPIPLSLIIGCLYRHTHPYDEDVGENAAGRMLEPKCSTEVLRVMKERAMEVELNPELETTCKASLGNYCSEDEATKNIEFLCLQEKYPEMVNSLEDHDKACAEMVAELTGVASEELDLEQVLFAACEPMVEKFCSKIVKQDDEGQVLGCLINHKNDQDMDEKCRAGVFHFQIISLSDYKLSYAFFKACKRDIHNNCATQPGNKQSKPDIVHCLSQQIRDDILREANHAISDECRKQVNFELLAEFEHIKLNPDLAKHCEADIKNYCPNTKQGSGRVEECLKKQESNLSKQCIHYLFQDMKIQAENPVVDYYLIKACKEVIKSHCTDSVDTMTHVVDCLARLKNDKDMTSTCKKAVRARQIVANENIQLNPILMEACKLDVTKVCSAEFGKVKNAPETMSDEEKMKMFEGSVISCLKSNFVKAQASKTDEVILTKSCAAHVEQLMKEEQKDFELDPELVKYCGKKHAANAPLNTVCKPSEHTDPVECLKEKFMDEELKGDDLIPCRKHIAKLLQEGQVDANVDATLQNACGLDIKAYCSDIDPGHGRRITCLVNRMKKEPKTLTEECLTKLKDRQVMWNKAQSVLKVEGLQDLTNVISRSSHAQYIFGVLAAICVGLMCCGIWLGRLTSHARERKAL